MSKWSGCWAVGLLILLSGCSLPYLEGRTRSYAINADQARETQLGRGVALMREGQGELNGFYALHEPLDAFAARVLLAEAAEKTLDVQYYIWRPDRSGILLLETLLDAAERGVRVRLLLDDIGTSGLDGWLAALDGHENFEVRLFNPFMLRKAKGLGFLTDFTRANRRMHNKAMIADNSVAIVGGRNIGDAYFAAFDDDDEEDLLFIDLDVLAIGPIVSATSNQFDDYWASASSYPVGFILPAAGERERRQLHDRSSLIEAEAGTAQYMQTIAQLPFFRQLEEGSLPLEWAPARLVADHPRKGLRHAAKQDLMFDQIQGLLASAEQQLDLVSPYFVPTDNGLEMLLDLQGKGTQVRILTNALEATDVAVVHSGYAKYRPALLSAGVQLYEMRLPVDVVRPKEKAGFWGRSGSSLHAKTFAVDSRKLYIGSFNFDPRSALLNTEMGFVIDSPRMAQSLIETFDSGLYEDAYHLQLDDAGNVYWRDRAQTPEQYLTTEPGTGFWQRLGIRVLGWLPIESFL